MELEITHVQLTLANAPRAVVMLFGKPAHESCGATHRTVTFRPGSVFALMRIREGSKSTCFHFSILRAVQPSEPASKVTHVWPKAEVLLRLAAWDKVMRALRVIEGIEKFNITWKRWIPITGAGFTSRWTQERRFRCTPTMSTDDT